MQFHLLSFEGPDLYSKVGGLATRVDGLLDALCAEGHATHLWFVGDPELPGHETQGLRHLHRWCQSLSHSTPGGVYDGEQAKAIDYATSLPPFLLQTTLAPYLLQGGRAVVIAEEWQTVNAVLHLDWLLQQAGLRDRVSIIWNANNTFGFDQIDWNRLASAAVITTVSRYMKFLMQPLGVDAIVIPNGLAPDAFLPAQPAPVRQLRALLPDRTLITKMARWDPDKRWLATIELAAVLKRQGWKPLVIARGGTEPHGAEVIAAARAKGLRIVDRDNRAGAKGILEALHGLENVDLVNLRSHVDPEARRILFRASDTVLANSGHEPFGLVGLETMAVGGIACTGFSGEDYAIPGRNALVLQTENPEEFMGFFAQLRGKPRAMDAMRRAGRETARQYAWPEVITRNFHPHLDLLLANPNALVTATAEAILPDMVETREALVVQEEIPQKRFSAVSVRDAGRYIRSA